MFRDPSGSLKLPIYITESGRPSIKYICSAIWNKTLKALSTANQVIEPRSFLNEQEQYKHFQIHTEKAFP